MFKSLDFKIPQKLLKIFFFQKQSQRMNFNFLGDFLKKKNEMNLF
jgi:hypothetical protein